MVRLHSRTSVIIKWISLLTWTCQNFCEKKLRGNAPMNTLGYTPLPKPCGKSFLEKEGGGQTSTRRVNPFALSFPFPFNALQLCCVPFLLSLIDVSFVHPYAYIDAALLRDMYVVLCVMCRRYVLLLTVLSYC
jgi:hypothetical protein